MPKIYSFPTRDHDGLELGFFILENGGHVEVEKEKASIFSVFGHLKTGGREELADFETHAECAAWARRQFALSPWLNWLGDFAREPAAVLFDDIPEPGTDEKFALWVEEARRLAAEVYGYADLIDDAGPDETRGAMAAGASPFEWIKLMGLDLGLTLKWEWEGRPAPSWY